MWRLLHHLVYYFRRFRDTHRTMETLFNQEIPKSNANSANNFFKAFAEFYR